MARDPDLDLLKAIRLLAFDAVKTRDSEYIIRHIQRWYSERYHVPLPEMDAVPLEDLLETYFEVRYEDMEDHDRDEELAALVETRDERVVREKKEREEAAEDEEFLAEAKAEALAQRAKLGPIKLPGSGGEDDDLKDVPETIPVPVMGSGLPSTFKEVVDKADPKLRKVDPEGIKMTFIDKHELDEMDDWDVLGPPRPKDKL